jgi:hypothetical protein
LRNNCASRRANDQTMERTRIPTASMAAVAAAATWAKVGGTTIATTAMRCVGFGQGKLSVFSLTPANRRPRSKPYSACTQTGTSPPGARPAVASWHRLEYRKMTQKQHRHAVSPLISKFEIFGLPPEKPHTWYPRIPSFARWGCSSAFSKLRPTPSLSSNDSSHHINV